MATRDQVQPRSFYLNEQHELTRGEKPSGGSLPKLAPINWANKGHRISRSLAAVRQQLNRSVDPTKDSRYFVLAKPVPTVEKLSDNKRKAPSGRFAEETSYSSKDSRVFSRLGIDLLKVTENGDAVVHVIPERIEQLLTTARSLAEVGVREQARWATIQEFQAIPASERIDEEWLTTISPTQRAEVVIELQPLLTRSEVETVIRAIAERLRSAPQEALVGTGTDFSGRHWLRGNLGRSSLVRIAEDFFSVEALHSPMRSVAAARSQPRGVSRARVQAASSIPVNAMTLPCVAVVDTGVPQDHLILAPYRRGAYVSPDSVAIPHGTHGTFVSSRVVFGDFDYTVGASAPSGEFSYFDIRVPTDGQHIDDKRVVTAMAAVVATAPDVRVFNLSFDGPPLNTIEPVKRQEWLSVVQDLDNFIFQNDIIAVISAGNSPDGLIPSSNYPEHYDDPNWALGPWARSFNSLTSGSYVNRLTPGGIVTSLGWPSPFCRTGPGLADSPKPDFSAHGGNGNETYHYAPGLGVWGLSPAGQWEDRSGTSFAAPLLAREVARCFELLQRVCESGSRPFGVAVKALLALTAVPPVIASSASTLIDRTLGRGTASTARLLLPLASSATFLWQGVLENKDDIARIQLSIPRSWLNSATKPMLRIVFAWDPPVNAAVRDIWACRRVQTRLRADLDANAVHPKGRAHDSYPLGERIYDLGKIPENERPESDVWLVELSYEDIAEYYPALAFPSQQRVAFAAELYDPEDHGSSLQAAIQALPLAVSMNRLSVTPIVVRTPIPLKTRS